MDSTADTVDTADAAPVQGSADAGPSRRAGGHAQWYRLSGLGGLLAGAILTHGALRGAFAPKTWCVLTLSGILILALTVPATGRDWLPAAPQAEFFAWWATACLAARFGFGMAWKRALALSQTPDEVEEPRLSGEHPTTRRLVTYGQEIHHGTAYIVGSRDALEAIGHAVSTAVSTPSGVLDHYPSGVPIGLT